MSNLLQRLVDDEDGQDIVEYALLTASVGLMGIATWPLIAASIGLAYQDFDTQTQDIWETPPPGTP